MPLWKLTIASIKMYVRNRQAIFWALFFPIVLMVVLGIMNFDDDGVFDLGVVNRSSSPHAAEFTKSLKEISSLEIFESGEKEERRALEKGERDVVLVLPEEFFVNPGKTDQTTVEVLINEGRPQATGPAMALLNQVFSEFERSVSKTPRLFILETVSVNSRNLRYIDFLVPGVIALSIMQLAVFSIAFTVVEYKEKGVMKRLFASPLRPMDFTLSQVFTRLIVSLAQVLILILVAVLVFNVTIVGSYVILGALTILGSILYLGFGFAVSGLSKNQDSAAAIANLFVFPQMFLGNIFFPTESMPEWLQHVVQYLPLNYLAEATRRVSTEAAVWQDLGFHFLGLAAWTCVSLFCAFWLFRWGEERR